MTRKSISNVIGNISDKYLISAMDGMIDTVTNNPGEVIKMRPRSRFTFRKTAGIAIAACLVLAMCVSAYAANLLGIRDMLRKQEIEISDSAVEDIAVNDENNDYACASQNGWKARVSESLYEGGNAIITVFAECDDRYVLAPTNASPNDAYFGTTLTDYAAENEKTILFVGAQLLGEKLNVSSSSQDFEMISDHEMEILVYASIDNTSEKVETICTVYALEDGNSKVDDVQRIEIPFTLVQGKATEMVCYKVENADVVGAIHFGEAKLFSTPLGIEVLIELDGSDVEKIEKITCNELTDMNGGLVLGQDNVWRLHWFRSSGEIEEGFSLNLYAENNTPIGSVVFSK